MPTKTFDLSTEQQAGLHQALSGLAPERPKRWRARNVEVWMAQGLGRPVATQRGWD